MKNKIFKLLYVFIIIWTFNSLNGQFIKIPIEDKYQNAELIIEGEFVTSRPYLTDDDMILTENIIEVKKIFKGGTKIGSQIAIITMGGTIGDRTDTWTHMLGLSKGDIGTFFLISSRRPI